MGNYFSGVFLASAKGVRGDVLIYWFVLIYAIIAAIIVEMSVGLRADTLLIYTRVWLVNYGLIFPLCFASVGFIKIIHRLDNRRLLAFRHMFSQRRVGRFLAGSVLFVAILVFTTSFTSLKNVASANTAFTWDVAFANLDHFIHFGHDPWRLLYGAIENTGFLRVLELNYNILWFVLNYSLLYWVAVSPQADGVRLRYMMGFFFVWVILGSAVGPMMLSAGPAFYGLVTGDVERFGGQVAFLASSKGMLSSAADYQSYLWTLREMQQTSFGSGILAFPSVHVALTMLNALFAWEFNRRIGLVAFAYVGVILFSSIYLGWHYGVDGYFSIIAVVGFYFASRAVMFGWARKKEMQKFATPVLA